MALWAGLVPGLVSAVAGDAPRALQFGVLNQQSAPQTAARWNPVLQYLGRSTGLPVQLRMGTTIAQTDAMMGREEFDLAFANHNFQSEYDGRYRVIARWSGPPVRGVIVVRPVFVSEPYLDLPVIAHPRLPREQVEAITRVMLGMKDDPEGRVVLAQARCAGFDAATDPDYDKVRRIYRAIGQ